MQAMVFSGAGTRLVQTEMAPPRPNEQQVLIRVSACAVCRTDLHVIDRELADPKLPLIPGHEIVGVVISKGAQVDRFALGGSGWRAVARVDVRHLRFLPYRTRESV